MAPTSVILVSKMQKDLSKELSGELEDEDVENERKRILEQPRTSLSSAVLIKELTKVTSTRQAWSRASPEHVMLSVQDPPSFFGTEEYSPHSETAPVRQGAEAFPVSDLQIFFTLLRVPYFF